MDRSYGTLVKVPADRVIETADGMTLELAGRPLLFLDTPGHASHHHCIWDERTRSFFTGDTFGLSHRAHDTARGAFIMPTTPPVQFQPEALRRSVERLLAFSPQRMLLTHYGAVEDVPRLSALFLAQLDEMVAAARPLAKAPDRHAALKRALEAIHLRRLREHGVTLAEAELRDLLGLDFELNAQGIAIWLDRTGT